MRKSKKSQNPSEKVDEMEAKDNSSVEVLSNKEETSAVKIDTPVNGSSKEETVEVKPVELASKVIKVKSTKVELPKKKKEIYVEPKQAKNRFLHIIPGKKFF